MSTLIVVLFAVQLVILLALGVAILLVYSPLKRFISPLKNLTQVIKSLVETLGRVSSQVINVFGRVRGNVSRLSNIFAVSRTGLSRLSLKKLFLTIVAGKRLFGVLKVLRQFGKNKFWGTFRILMLAGPIVVPILSSLKRFIRKPA
jgi:hypothetical protein